MVVEWGGYVLLNPFFYTCTKFTHLVFTYCVPLNQFKSFWPWPKTRTKLNQRVLAAQRVITCKRGECESSAAAEVQYKKKFWKHVELMHVQTSYLVFKKIYYKLCKECADLEERNPHQHQQKL